MGSTKKLSTKSKRGGPIGALNPPEDCRQMVVSSHYVYVADAWYGLRIIDVSNPSNPIEVGNYSIGSGNIGLTIRGNFVYLANNAGGSTRALYRINVANPNAPFLVNKIADSSIPGELAINGNYLYTPAVDGLRTYDISNTSIPPKFLNQYSIPGSLQGNIVRNGQYLYVGNQDYDFRIYDVSTASTPNLLATCAYTSPPAIGITDVTFLGNYAYLATGTTTLKIVNIADPSNPDCSAASYTIPGGLSAYKLERRANYLYLGTGVVLNIDNPTAPIYAGASGLGEMNVNQGIIINSTFAYTGKNFNVVKIAPPVLVNSQLTVSEGQTVTLTTSNFSATDADDGNNALIFTISSFSGEGRFQLVSSPGVSITSFTQQQVVSGAVQFVDNGDEVAPSFKISVSDGMIFTQPKAVTVNYTPVNDAPVLSSSSTTSLTYVENSSPVVINPNLVVTDVDSTNLASATVTITGYVAGEDVLNLPTNPQNGISANFNSSNGVLTLTGSSNVANYQAALRTVTYENSSPNPSTTARSIGIRVNDGVANSGVVSRSLSVTTVNGAPVLSSSNTGALTLLDTDSTAIVDSNLTIDDVDSTDLVSAYVTITGYVAGEDILSLPVNPQNGITADFDTNTGILTLSGSSTLANYQAALQTITYQNLNIALPSERIINFVVNDGTLDSNISSRNLALVPLSTLISKGSTDLLCFNQESAKLIYPEISVLGNNTLILESASIIIEDNSATDLLEFTDLSSGISGNYDNSTGVLLLSGSASANDYEAILRTVTYTSTDLNSTSPDKTFNITVNFEGQTSNTLASELILITSNNAPVVINPIDDFNVTVGQPFSQTLNVSNIFNSSQANLDYEILDENGNLPTELTFDKNTHQLSGTFSEVGTNRFAFFAQGLCNLSTSTHFAIDALPEATPPVPGAPIQTPTTPTPPTSTVQPPLPPESNHTAAIVGGVVGGVAGLLALGGIIFGSIWAWRKKQAKENATMDSAEELADKTLTP